MSPIDRSLAYHARSKHHPNRFAPSLGYLDWATQPDPFRTYDGAPRVDLPLLERDLSPSYRDFDNPAVIPARPLSLSTLATLLELSLGLSAWKQQGRARWALRCNPSSGNLHPTEGYVLVPEAPELPAGLYHYVSRDHAIERRSSLEGEGALAELLPPGGFIVGLSSIHWREAWKYGERAFRYCQHDVGHAVASVRYAAAALGFSAVLLDGLGDTDSAAILGLDRDADFADVEPLDREHPDAAILVTPSGVNTESAASSLMASAGRLRDVVRGGAWAGRANTLSPSHVGWPIIADVAEATWKPATQPHFDPLPPAPAQILSSGRDATLERSAASALIRRRRSAVDFDGQTSIDAATFYAMLDHLLPRPRSARIPPWDAVPWAPRIHLGLFVHRVRGLEPGLYAFERDPSVDGRLRAATNQELLWKRPDGCPDHLRLYLLMDVDLRDTAQLVSCNQAIAGDGAFSAGMLADFEAPIRDRGASIYRRLFWEAGVLGQVLYLEAEAASTVDAPVRATGIGCYFDDLFHELLGLEGSAFQSLYHFTVGGPVEDRRLATLPPYAHLGARRRC
ncbi:MAG TPA: SagB/ThcOx family dehydrogenase [Polyangiaceae bacterium]|nr:SagB/ThcOx family dehydrogenase [Polyangiaceae bacterium]